jgi:tRNA U34 2-thiouridine synthase MnmA/TrmU
MIQQDVEVTALTFMTHFGCDLASRSPCGSDPRLVADKFGFNVEVIHLGQKFIDIVENPRYGRGANMNVCVDCRILMLKEARACMEKVNADFVVTGEVVGQRPFSQVKHRLNLVEKQSGLRGKLLRPLSAKLLKPTEPELIGLVDRDKLESISGRGRKRQLELARQFGLEDFPNPAAGCLLTDRKYSRRLRDLLDHVEHLTSDDIDLLRYGRHFRLDRNTKVIVGRNKQDNHNISQHKRPHHIFLEALNTGSPLTLLIGSATEENIRTAAAITARYSSARKAQSVRVAVRNERDTAEISVSPATNEDVSGWAIR